MPYERLGKLLAQKHLNDVLDALELQNLMQFGRGVLRGCMLSVIPNELAVMCSDGTVFMEAVANIGAERAELLPNSTAWVWRDERGRLLVTPTNDSPGGLFVCVGRAVTGAAQAVLVDGDSRMEPARMNPDDCRSFVTRCELLPKGPLLEPVAEVFTDGDLLLTPRDRNIQVIDPGANDITVTLFDDPRFGNWFRIHNNGEAWGGKVAVVHGETVLATLDTGGMAELRVRGREWAGMTDSEIASARSSCADAMTRKARGKMGSAGNRWFVASLLQ